MRSNINSNYSSLRSSEVDSTFTSSCFLSILSFDQSGQAHCNANAKYSASFGSGAICFAFERKDLYSTEEIILILDRIMEEMIFRSPSEYPDFCFTTERYFSSSSRKNSGEMSSKSEEKSISLVTPSAEISAARTMFASMTIFTSPQAPYIFTCRSWMPFRIFLPSPSASFSVNLDLAVMAFKIANWATFSRMAALATSDQFISLNSSISCFKSSGTDKVIVGIGSSPPSRNTVNTHNAVNLYKCFAG